MKGSARLIWNLRAALAVAGCAFLLCGRAPAAEPVGIYERIFEASASFDETAAAFEAALAGSPLVWHGKFDLVLKEPVQRARVYLLTSPHYLAAAAAEAPETASAQVLRVAIYEFGPRKAVHIDMGNPLAQAMVFYSGSSHYDALLAAARDASNEVRAVVAGLPGKPVSVQLEPQRSESALNHFQGDGMAKMMAKWRNWKESQATLFTEKPENFSMAVARVEQSVRASRDRGIDDASGWRLVAKIPVGASAVVFGISNAYTEWTCVRINSGSRSGDKSADAPYPGVDHAPALPLEILVVNDGRQVRAVQYGEMWRMQLYFWDSGYLAFAGNSGVPGAMFDAIGALFEPGNPAAAGSGR